MKKLGIIGYGRFGALLASLAQHDCSVHVVETNSNKQAAAREAGFDLITFDQLKDMDIIVPAVPISSFESIVKQLASIVHKAQLVADVCSVKVYPATIMKRYLTNCQILATHPLFGPDSAKTGLRGLSVALCPLQVSDNNLNLVATFWEKQGVKVIYTTPEEHDKETVYSQAFTYSISRIVLGMQLPQITFTTKSYNKLAHIADLSARDTEQLFHDMLYYNPYFTNMRRKLTAAIAETEARLDEIEEEQSNSNWL